MVERALDLGGGASGGFEFSTSSSEIHVHGSGADFIRASPPLVQLNFPPRQLPLP